MENKKENGLFAIVEHYHYDEAQVEKLAVLVRSGTDTNIVDKNGVSPLMCVAKHSVSYLSESYDFYLKRSVNYCLTMLNLLLDAGADVNTRDTEGRTVFMLPEVIAIGEKSIGLLLALLPNHANVSSQDRQGNTALMYAVMGLHINTVQLFLSKGANVNIKNDLGLTAFELLAQCRSGSSEVIGAITRALLKAGAETAYESERTKGKNPYAETSLALRQELVVNSKKYEPTISENAKLLDATIENNQSLVEAALQHGADANTKTIYGDTPLMLASIRNYPQIVKILLKHGAIPDLADESGDTALILAEGHGHQHIAALLLNAITKTSSLPNAKD